MFERNPNRDDAYPRSTVQGDCNKYENLGVYGYPTQELVDEAREGVSTCERESGKRCKGCTLLGVSKVKPRH